MYQFSCSVLIVGLDEEEEGELLRGRFKGRRREARSPQCEGKLIIYYCNKGELCPKNKYHPSIPRKAE